jgi:hypothetical protein
MPRRPGMPKTGGRKKGSKNKPITGVVKKSLGREAFETLAQLDRSGKSMAQIQLEAARFVAGLAEAQRARIIALGRAPEPQLDQITAAEDRAVKLSESASKLAKDVSGYLYPALQSIKHAGDEDSPPIRIESLSDFQLEQLIRRLSRG